MKVNIFNNHIRQIPFNENEPYVEITEEQLEGFMAGKLKVENGVIVDNTETLTKQARISEIQTRLNKLSQDFMQAELGADFGKTTLEDGTVVNVIDLRKQEFITLHNELRTLLNKEPRIYI